MPKRVAVIGPESTGKSTLCVGLANYYATNWVPEYAREYLSSHGLKYNYDDLLVIAQTQIQLEDQIAAASSGAVFIDTNLYVMKVWCEFVYGKCHQWILNTIARRSYDLYDHTIFIFSAILIYHGNSRRCANTLSSNHVKGFSICIKTFSSTRRFRGLS
jgi:NadR type nicotinamide-nucleotide adenylyltransferase